VTPYATKSEMMLDVTCNIALGTWYYFIFGSGNGGPSVVWVYQYCQGSGVAGNLHIGMACHLMGAEAAHSSLSGADYYYNQIQELVRSVRHLLGYASVRARHPAGHRQVLRVTPGAGSPSYGTPVPSGTFAFQPRTAGCRWHDACSGPRHVQALAMLSACSCPARLDSRLRRRIVRYGDGGSGGKGGLAGVPEGPPARVA